MSDYDKIALKRELERDEGRAEKIYIDTEGKVTGGIGRNLTDRAFLSNEIDLMYSNDIRIAENALDANFPWWRSMSDARQRALLNMCFNLGIARLLGFRLMLRALEAKDYQQAHDQALASRWATQVGNRAVRIAEMFLYG